MNSKFKESCDLLITQEGSCAGIDCNDCPFGISKNQGIDCVAAGFTSRDTRPKDKDSLLVASAKQWLKANAPPAPLYFLVPYDTGAEPAFGSFKTLEAAEAHLESHGYVGGDYYVCRCDNQETWRVEGTTRIVKEKL